MWKVIRNAIGQTVSHSLRGAGPLRASVQRWGRGWVWSVYDQEKIDQDGGHLLLKTGFCNDWTTGRSHAESALRKAGSTL